MSGIFDSGYNYFELRDFDQLIVLKLGRTTVQQRYQDRQREFNDVMLYIESKQQPLLAFDFSRCEFIDSVTIGMLIQLTYHVRQRDGNAVRVQMNGDMKEVFTRLMMLETRTAVWEQYADLSTAIQALPW